MSKRRNILLVGGVAGLVIMLGGVLFALNNSNYEPNTNVETGVTLGTDSEQINESIRQQQEELVMQPDINNAEFVLIGSSVACSSTEVNGDVSKSCSGNVRIVPKANDAMSAGLYKINEQTKLHGGQEQDLTTLQQLSENQTTVRLTLAANSESMLAEIRY